MASSSGTTLSNSEHDAFVSCCFEDTGINFTSHLLSALDREAIIAIIDDRQDEGNEISETLLAKISKSLVYVVILSINYGGSPRCLNQLVEITRCAKEYKLDVLPVFRGVKPTHVRYQNGAFGDAFEKMLTGDQQLKENEEKWRRALVEAAAASGWDSENTSSEAEMVNKVVERIKNIVNKLHPEDSYDGFVGIAQVEKIKSLLHLQLVKGVQSVGIWGTGGIGKTTIAERVYCGIKNQFDSACFLTNVGDRLKRGKLKSLRNDMLNQLLESHNFRRSFDFSTKLVQINFLRKKFLIVLDDVIDARKLKHLVKPHECYGNGSRIILTSRDKQVLKSCDCEEEHIYEVKELNHSEALRLFEFHAFKQQPYSKRYKELLEKALSYAKGLPLALVILGCNLYDKNVEEWESELKKIEEIPDRTINDILMISFAGLDETEKGIFLDIACVFLGWRRNQVERILNACKFYATSGIRNLQNKALITILDGRLRMHALLRQMGQNIVVQECKEEPGRLSRIWKYKDFVVATTRNEITKKVEVISVDLSQVTDMVLLPETFEKLSQLRVLNLYDHSYKGIKIQLPEGLGFKSDRLAYLRWDHYHLKSLPDKIDPMHLVELKLVGSGIVHLTSGGVELGFPNLKVMDLSFSKNLSSLPDASRYPNLERLKLMCCYKLEEMPSSIQCLSELWYLDLNGCSNLTKLPDLPNLKELYLDDCKNLTSISDFPSNLLFLSAQRCTSLRSLGNLFGEGPSRFGCFEFNLVNSINLDDDASIRCVTDARTRIEATAAWATTHFRSSKMSLTKIIEITRLQLMHRSIVNQQRQRMTMESSIENYGVEIYEGEEEDDIWDYKQCYGGSAYLCIPGSTVPKWVKYRREGPSVKLKLSGGTLEDFSRLAFCFVVSSSNSPKHLSSMASCNCRLVTDDFGEIQVETTYEPEYGSDCLESEHVFLWYDDIRTLLWPCDKGDTEHHCTPLMCSEATFEFQFKIESLSFDSFQDKGVLIRTRTYCPILRCGVTNLARNSKTKRSSFVEDDGSQGGRRRTRAPSGVRLKNSEKAALLKLAQLTKDGFEKGWMH